MITPEVHALRERLQIPGMAVLQFGFGDTGAHMYLPHRLTHNHVVYTGTHDNNTTLGWWECCSDYEKKAARTYIGEVADGVNWAFIRAALSSVATLAVVPLQDVLGLNADCRMNTPSQADGNWRWRYCREALKPDLARKLADLAEVTDRLPQPCPVPPDEPFAA
jgi:4-alpha-glucanotransferase